MSCNLIRAHWALGWWQHMADTESTRLIRMQKAGTSLFQSYFFASVFGYTTNAHFAEKIRETALCSVRADLRWCPRISVTERRNAWNNDRAVSFGLMVPVNLSDSRQFYRSHFVSPALAATTQNWLTNESDAHFAFEGKFSVEFRWQDVTSSDSDDLSSISNARVAQFIQIREKFQSWSDIKAIADALKSHRQCLVVPVFVQLPRPTRRKLLRRRNGRYGIYILYPTHYTYTRIRRYGGFEIENLCRNLLFWLICCTDFHRMLSLTALATSPTFTVESLLSPSENYISHDIVILHMVFFSIGFGRKQWIKTKFN